MSELKLTLEPELESPSLGGVPTLTLDSAEAEKKPEPEVPEEPVPVSYTHLTLPTKA